MRCYGWAMVCGYVVMLQVVTWAQLKDQKPGCLTGCCACMAFAKGIGNCCRATGHFQIPISLTRCALCLCSRHSLIVVPVSRQAALCMRRAILMPCLSC